MIERSIKHAVEQFRQQGLSADEISEIVWADPEMRNAALKHIILPARSDFNSRRFAERIKESAKRFVERREQ